MADLEEGREGGEKKIGHERSENTEGMPDSVNMEDFSKKKELAEGNDEIERKKARKERVYRLVRETVVITITIGLPAVLQHDIHPDSLP